jgi:hypothetical protein
MPELCVAECEAAGFLLHFYLKISSKLKIHSSAEEEKEYFIFCLYAENFCLDTATVAQSM